MPLITALSVQSLGIQSQLSTQARLEMLAGAEVEYSISESEVRISAATQGRTAARVSSSAMCGCEKRLTCGKAEDDVARVHHRGQSRTTAFMLGKMNITVMNSRKLVDKRARKLSFQPVPTSMRMQHLTPNGCKKLMTEREVKGSIEAVLTLERLTMVRSPVEGQKSERRQRVSRERGARTCIYRVLCKRTSVLFSARWYSIE